MWQACRRPLIWCCSRVAHWRYSGELHTGVILCEMSSRGTFPCYGIEDFPSDGRHDRVHGRPPTSQVWTTPEDPAVTSTIHNCAKIAMPGVRKAAPHAGAYVAARKSVARVMCGRMRRADPAGQPPGLPQPVKSRLSPCPDPQAHARLVVNSTSSLACPTVRGPQSSCSLLSFIVSKRWHRLRNEHCTVGPG